MKSALCGIIAAILSFAPPAAMAQSSQIANKTIKYEQCDNSDYINNSFVIGLFTERGWKCYEVNHGSYLSPEGSKSCTVSVRQDGSYVNHDCPKDVFDQVKKDKKH